MSGAPLALFEGFGVELEYMIVDRETLDVLPVADRVLREVAGEVVNEVERGRVAWSNELVLHVIELKANGPAPRLEGLDDLFQANVREVDALAARSGGRLMPTAMHPWMDPFRETVLWPHGHNEIYATFNRIFDCRGHGWSNLQSAHLNLPFRGDDEFGRLHAAIRLVLPLLPALAASSPVHGGRANGIADNRLAFYWDNSRKIDSITGQVVPEDVFSSAEYEERIYRRLRADIAPHDPEGVLEDVWLNARGAIARFDRGAIEIRILDVQECPKADLAIHAAVVETLRALVAGRWEDGAAQRRHATEPLSRLLRRTVDGAETTIVEDASWLRALGFPGRPPVPMGDVWRHLVETLPLAPWRPTLDAILDRGPLSRRIARALGGVVEPPRERLREAYRELSDCLVEGRLFGVP